MTKSSYTILGSARSGLAAARLLAGQGARVFLSERGAGTREERAELDRIGAEYEFGGHTERAMQAEALVVSPGVPTEAPPVQRALGLGIPVYSEIEVASWFCRAPIVAITGTNGKTTTTSLLHHVFATAFEGTDRRAIICGNIGAPFSDYAATATERDVIVLEVSSFQLDHIDRFRPRVAVLLGITPDHLDRYGGDVERYAAAKLRLYENQRAGDVLVYNHDDARLREAAQSALSRALGFGLDASAHTDPRLAGFVRQHAGGAGHPGEAEATSLVLRLPPSPHDEVLMHAHHLALPGRHNLYNSLATAIAARVMEVRSDVVRESLASFEGVPHRLEFVREVGGVRYVNDSKATNVNAVWYALESYRQPVVLIAGGRDKGNDYSSLKPLVRRGCRAVVAFGESAAKVETALGLAAPDRARAETLEEAVRQAHFFAEPGDVVLLSPACSSFDLFDNYEHRGDVFKRLVHSLPMDG